MKAAQAGHGVFCTSVKRLGTKIRKAQERNTLDVLFKQILTTTLWILDDWGVVSMARDVSEEIFDLFDRRKHNSAMILASNRDVEEWPQVFINPILAGAAIDRMFEGANINRCCAASKSDCKLGIRRLCQVNGRSARFPGG